MIRKRNLLIETSIVLGGILAGCGNTPKQGAVPLHVDKHETKVDSTTMQGDMNYSPFDKNGNVKMNIHTAPNTHMYLKNSVPKSYYDYKVDNLGKGNYNITFHNNGIRNEEKYPEFNYIVAKSAKYKHSSQSKIGLHTTTTGVQQNMIQNIQTQLKHYGAWNDKLFGKAKTNIITKYDGEEWKINIISNFTPMPPTNTIIAALKRIQKADMSTVKMIAIKLGTNDGNSTWYTFNPYDIKIMPLNQMIDFMYS